MGKPRAGWDSNLLGISGRIENLVGHSSTHTEKPCAFIHAQCSWLDKPRLLRILPISLTVNTRREFPSVARAGSRLRQPSCKQKLGWEELVDSEAFFPGRFGVNMEAKSRAERGD